MDCFQHLNLFELNHLVYAFKNFSIYQQVVAYFTQYY